MAVTDKSDDFDVGTDVHAAINDLTRRLAEHSKNVDKEPIIKVAQPEHVPYLRKIGTPGAAHDVGTVLEEAFTAFDFRLRVNHPRFMGLIPSPTSPVAWLGDVVASAFNALGASKLQASGPVVIEKTLIEWLASRIGFPATAGGVCVSGGSMANLMGIVLARDRCVPHGEEQRAVAYLSDQTHYSVAKALRLLGFKSDRVRKLPSDESFRMDVGGLQQATRDDRASGLMPFLVVGSCGTTNTGAVDPLKRIADVCKTEGMWLHVDGAYGASVSLSATRRDVVNELQYADSLSWDAHKWLFQTYSCGLFIVKDKANMVKSFANKGDYLRDGTAFVDDDIPNFWNYTMELTRPASRAMKLWFTLRVIGTERIGEMIDHGFKLAERAESEIRALQDWEILSPANMGVVTFRYAARATAAEHGQHEEALDAINSRISKELISSNVAGILTTKVQGKVALRICALSPHLALEDMAPVHPVALISEEDIIVTKQD
ncbi:pyridoxal phosphate-dependent transferase [Emericellopsis atlantica]|uniref:Pyridoxal phosphate-dependent transferase n=1 Tax=Emericellopsis atlantica TaxID=2614577 RepID=A0A9P7ZIZ6_9HYPO|nr:pyridoxal phosphate-dependent transferase [Emericellopsis atlantica]KAG9252378.1 pyridoxal phosphate-dependent transferase [Emericellopsis atlantica]